MRKSYGFSSCANSCYAYDHCRAIASRLTSHASNTKSTIDMPPGCARIGVRAIHTGAARCTTSPRALDSADCARRGGGGLRADDALCECITSSVCARDRRAAAARTARLNALCVASACVSSSSSPSARVAAFASLRRASLSIAIRNECCQLCNAAMRSR
jgi:hypothetical protein